MARNFKVSPLDLDSRTRRFSSVNAALRFAVGQAKQSWRGYSWSVAVVNDKGEDTDIRLVIDVSRQVVILDHGVQVGTGVLSSKGYLHTTEPVWDLIEQFCTKGH